MGMGTAQSCTADALRVLPKAAAGSVGTPLLEEVVQLCASPDTLEAGDAGAERVLSAALGTVDAALMSSLSKPQQQRLLVALAALTAKGSSEATRDAARAATARLDLTPGTVLPLLAAPLVASSGEARKASAAKTPAKRSKKDSGKAAAVVAVDALDGEALQRCVGVMVVPSRRRRFCPCAHGLVSTALFIRSSGFRFPVNLKGSPLQVPATLKG
jgi:hypothetical protein